MPYSTDNPTTGKGTRKARAYDWKKAHAELTKSYNDAQYIQQRALDVAEDDARSMLKVIWALGGIVVVETVLIVTRIL